MINPGNLSLTDQQEYVMNLALGYQVSQVLFAAIKMDIFTLLDTGGQDISVLTRTLQGDENALRRFLAVLLDLKLLDKKGNFFYNTGISSRYLVKGKKGYLGHSIHHSNNLCEFWESLDEPVIKGSPRDPGNEYLDDYPHRLTDYLSAMNETGELKADTIADIISIGNFRKMLDIGCGPGTYALEFSQRNPALNATLIDLEPNLQYTRERVSGSTVRDRVTLIACQILEEDVPGSGYDLVFISNLIHIYDKAEVEHILSKSWNVLSSSGSMVIHDYIIGVTGSKPFFTSLFDLTMFLGTPRGRCYDREELSEILDHLGARRKRFIPLKLGTSLLMAEK